MSSSKFLETKTWRFFIPLIVIGIFSFSSPLNLVLSETLTSPNYRIDGATVGGGTADTSDSGTGNFSLFTTVSDFSGNPRVTSSAYELRPGNPETFLANTPQVSCFETTSSGSSDCTSAPAYVNSSGMVRVCGSTGCYNKARMEIDIQNNPADTLYSVQISDDNFATDLQVIDGVTFRPKPLEDKELADFLSKSAWETPVFNILGLQSGTQYWIRVTALHGDFTESSPSPVATATTANATVSFDIDITDMNETNPETAAPYTIAFTGGDQLVAGGAQVRATNLIWLDSDTNAEGGIAIIHDGLYGGLYSANGSYTINSATADLAVAAEGFGIQNYDYSGTETYQDNYSGNSDLGEITVETDYNGADYNVGIVDTDAIKLYDGDGPIDSGRTATMVRARASTSASQQSDYTETITFIIVGRY